MTPITTRRPPRETVWAEGSTRGNIPSPLGPIPVWVWGDGTETVILVHGWSGRGLQLGAFVEPLVELGYRVVTFDAPGHGEATGRTSSMPAIAAALGTVARRFGPVSAVIAHSLGCTATTYALTQREFTADKVVAVSPAARLHAMRERFGEMTGFTPAIIDDMRAGIERRFGFRWDDLEPLKTARAFSGSLLVIHDDGDRFIPHREGEELADAWPDGRLITTTGLGHHRVLRDPEVVESVAGFVAETTTDTLERRAS